MRKSRIPNLSKDQLRIKNNWQKLREYCNKADQNLKVRMTIKERSSITEKVVTTTRGEANSRSKDGVTADNNNEANGRSKEVIKRSRSISNSAKTGRVKENSKTIHNKKTDQLRAILCSR